MKFHFPRPLFGPLCLVVAAVGGGLIGLWPYLDAARGRAGILPPDPFFAPPDEAVSSFLRSARAALKSRAEHLDAVRRGEPEPPWKAEEERAWAAVVGMVPFPNPESTWLSLYVPSRLEAERGPFVTDLQGGLAAALERLWVALPAGSKLASRLSRGRLKWDRQAGPIRRVDRQGGPSGTELDKGIDGVMLQAGEKVFRWLPSQPLEKQVPRQRILADLRKEAQTAGWTKGEANGARTSAFRTQAWIEGVDGSAVPLGRGNTDVPEVTVELLRTRIGLAAAYMARETNDRGKITYEYQGRDESTGTSYNLLRHAGSLYAMVQGWRVQPEPAVLEAGRRAADYLIRQTREDKAHPGERYTLDGSRSKLGGEGLGLMALVELEKAAPGSVEGPVLEGLARHIERMQRTDGSFQCFYNYDGKHPSLERSVFYPGEAMLGLIRLEQLTGDERWLDVAVRGADYLVHDQWVGYGIRVMIAPDAWLLQALEELDRVRPDADRRAYAFAVARAVAGNKLMEEDLAPPDLVGADISSIRNLPNAATAGSYGEALTAAARLEGRTLGRRGPWFDAAMLNARYQLRNQFIGNNAWWLANPERAFGAFRLRADDAEIRNDYVQHNLSGLFGLLPLLDPTAPDLGLRVAESSP